MKKKINMAFIMLCILLIFASCGKKPVNSVNSYVSTSVEPTSRIEESSRGSVASVESVESNRLESSNLETSKTEAPTSSKPTTTSSKSITPSSTPPPKPSTTTVPSTAPPAVKSIYDRPYDIPAIEKDMEHYVISKGGNYERSMNMENFGWWIDPLPTTNKWFGEKLRKELQGDIDYKMSLGRYSNFRVFFNPTNNGEYEITILCG